MTAAASNTQLFLTLCVCLVILSSLNETVGIRQLSAGSSESNLALNSIKIDGEYMILKPELIGHNKRPFFHGKEIKDCLPKGFRHASAPSRYVNYHIFGSLGCSQVKNFKQP
ncbi:hypothetical protein A4A49_09674 [Nicotiana attenuata]|uniref:Uncharacterized protein n=1 Tax=Nicotiana attenuata TaxID=49451 RepID=A0A1J6J5L7_NICAT|nr:hypothetical protein A4A49_09674 [Nicotiana attenuata]